MSQLDDIRARLEAATPGPWGWADGGSFGGWWLSHRADPAEPTIAATMGDDIRTVGNHANQEFIAHAPDAIALLLGRVDALTDALRAIHELPSDHDLLHNAMAKAVWTISGRVLGEAS